MSWSLSAVDNSSEGGVGRGYCCYCHYTATFTRYCYYCYTTGRSGGRAEAWRPTGTSSPRAGCLRWLF
eukprot:6576029-Prymnesium_polylepis.1